MALTMPNLFKIFNLENINIWKLLALIFALLNLKHVPFAWHLRTLNGLLSHLPLTKRRLLTHKTHLTPSALFQPMILASRAQPYEIDFNLHKSNSTYFADFDIARLHLMVRLCSPGLDAVGRELWLADGKQGPKRIRIMMGAVSCSFRREIKPMRGFEMWTKVLCWDRKWFYVVTFFVESGAVKPKGWTLQPWRRGGYGAKAKVEGVGRKEGEESKKRKGTHPAIFATGIAKYVCKRGRMTISPERILQASGLLPPKPAGQGTPPVTASANSPATGAVEGDEMPMGVAPAAKVRDMTSSAAEDLIDAALNVNTAGDQDGEWDWERVESQRQKGLRIAEAWGKTEELGEDFVGEEGMALGKYWDWF